MRSCCTHARCGTSILAILTESGCLDAGPRAPASAQQRNAARRFNILIDTLYEARTLLIASSEARRQVEFPHWVISGCACRSAGRQVNLNKRTPIPRTRASLPSDPSSAGRMTTCWTCSVGAFRRAFKSAARRPTYRRACGLGRVQRHTVRGVFSGTLKKKLGVTLTSVKEERGRVYRIAEPANL